LNDLKKKENQDFFIPRIEKPLIRIEADKELVVIDKKIGTMDTKQRGLVPADFEFNFDEKWEEYIWRAYQTGVIQHEDGTEERPFDKLKEEYLRLPGYEFVKPGYGVIS
jgi:hypothetical protein